MLDGHEVTRDHWWWRPGWSLGRSFYTWHLTFEQDSAVRALVPRFAPTLAKIATMEPVDEGGLHVTIQGIGFTDEVELSDVLAMADAAQDRLVACPRFDVQIGPPVVDSETIQLPVANPYGLEQIRAVLQDAIADVWGAGQVPERDDQFRPHLTLAYSTGATPIADVQDLLGSDGLADITASAHVDSVALIDLNRDRRKYEWTDIAKAILPV
ncbi:2'-5' RNA ligase family protein [Nocardia sp. NPDC088792]|uniref:2'-5' RNA ligase family protein n=1 Tax=Nocardia sp. NPDC088792 TaxID=3364332 RepID=UPI00382138FE